MNYQNSIKLNNGVIIPRIGLGVWQVREGQVATDTVSNAINTGYRLFDTAAFYGNEASVGRAIRLSKLPRIKVFVTTKLWNSDQGYDTTYKAFEKSINLLGMDYIDLYLIHFPSHDMKIIRESWKAFEELYKSKKIRAIGVSNFNPEQLDYLIKHSKVIPAVNQIELHPYNAQKQTREYCDSQGVIVESYSPLMHGGQILSDPLVNELSKKYQKTAAQIVLRWHIQGNLVVIPKSVTPSRIKENIDIFDFELSNSDFNRLNSLDRSKRIGVDPNGLAIRFYSNISRKLRSLKE